MASDFFDPTPEQQNVTLIDAASLRKAERLIESCESCNPVGAELPFDNILDRVTGPDPSTTDYILETPEQCSYCRRDVFGKDVGGASARFWGNCWLTASHFPVEARQRECASLHNAGQ